MALDRFFEAKKEIRPRTLQKYREIVQHQFSPCWRSMDLRSVTADMIVQQFHVIRKTAPARAWDFLKVYMNVWNTCAPLFRDTKDQRLLKQSPIPEARNMLKNLPRHVPKRSVIPASLLGKFVLIVERLRTGELLMQDDGDRPPSPFEIRMCDIALLTIFTAFRFNEARCLKWEYIDLDNGIIRLLGDAGKGASTFKGTKNRCDHHVPLSSYAWDLLRKIHGERLSANPYVFPAIYRASGPTSRNHTVFNRITVLLGTHYSPHTSRRTFASVADEAGLGFLTVKRLLNHTFQGGVTKVISSPASTRTKSAPTSKRSVTTSSTAAPNFWARPKRRRFTSI